MIKYIKLYRFKNELAEFSLLAETFEHPNAYGNGTLLVVDVKSVPRIFSSRKNYDIRYESVSSPKEIEEMVIGLIERDYGVSVDDIEEVSR